MPRGLLGPYLLFLGDIQERAYAKTAFGVRDWARDRCIGEFALAEGGITAGLWRLEPEDAYAQGARALLIGVATPGGLIPAQWRLALERSARLGLPVADPIRGGQEFERLADFRGSAELPAPELLQQLAGSFRGSA